MSAVTNQLLQLSRCHNINMYTNRTGSNRAPAINRDNGSDSSPERTAAQERAKDPRGHVSEWLSNLPSSPPRAHHFVGSGARPSAEESSQRPRIAFSSSTKYSEGRTYDEKSSPGPSGKEAKDAQRRLIANQGAAHLYSKYGNHLPDDAKKNVKSGAYFEQNSETGKATFKAYKEMVADAKDGIHTPNRST